MLFMPCVCHAFAFVHCCLMVTSWLYFVMYCDFVIFPFDNLRQVWYLIVSIPDPWCLSYFIVHKNCLLADDLYVTYIALCKFTVLQSEYILKETSEG